MSRLINDAPAAPVLQRPPFATPFFYGWIIVACITVAAFLSSGMTNLVMSVMLKPISDETGWSRTSIATVLATGATLGGLVSPLAGWLADRWGPRGLMSGSALVSGLLYFALAQSVLYPIFFASYVANRLITMSTMGGVVSNTAVANWFYYRRPRVMGIVGMAGPLGASIMAVVAAYLLEYSSWRAVMVAYGVLLLVFVVLPSAYLLRRSPEDLGLPLDGFTPEQSAAMAVRRSGGRHSPDDEVSFTVAQAARTPAMWFIIASLSVATFATTSIGVHQVAYLTDRGIGTGIAAAVLSVYALSAAVSNVLWGFLTEHYDERLLNVGALALAAVCIWFLTTVTTPVAAFVFAVFFGLFARGESALINIILAHYYGRRNFGAITGFTRPFQTAAGAAGPVIAAMTFDLTGSYIGAFNVLIGMFVVSAFLMYLAKRPALPAQPV